MSTWTLLRAIALGLALACLPFLHFGRGHAAHHGGSDVVASHVH